MTATIIPFPVAARRQPVRSVSPAHARRRLHTIVTGTVALWFGRWRARRRFAAEVLWMPDEALADFGMTRAEAKAAARRPFWKP